MKILNLIRFGGPVLVSVGLVACGGKVSSGVPPEKQADELTGEEINDVCEATIDYFEATIDPTEAFCRMVSVTVGVQAGIVLNNSVSVARESCDELYRSCLDDPNDALSDLTMGAGGTGGTGGVGGMTSIDFDLSGSCEDTPESLENCDVTVGDYETCMTEQIDAYDQALSEIPSCSTITADDLENGGDLEEPSMLEDAETPASCERVEAAMCEGLSTTL